jgi:CysZ protein
MTTQQNIRKTLPSSSFALFLRGLTYPLEGLRFLSEHKLWSMAAAAILVNVALLVAMIGLASVYLVPMIQGWVAAMALWAAGSTVLGWLAGFFSFLLWCLVGPVALVLGFLVLMLVGQTVASPFLDSLSEKVESLVVGTPVHPLTMTRVIKDVVIAFGDLVGGLLFIVAVNFPLFLVGLIPGVGAIAASIPSFCFSAWLLAQEFMGLSLVRKFVGYGDRWRAVWSNKAITLGFGATTTLLLFVPGLNLVLLPMAAVGGTLMYCDLKVLGRMPA